MTVGGSLMIRPSTSSGSLGCPHANTLSSFLFVIKLNLSNAVVKILGRSEACEHLNFQVLGASRAGVGRVDIQVSSLGLVGFRGFILVLCHELLKQV